jgi:hypothetical protein
MTDPVHSDVSSISGYEYARTTGALSLVGRLRHAVLGLPEGPGPMWRHRMHEMPPDSRERLVEVLRVSNRGFNAALATGSPDALPPLLDSAPSASLEVFAYEGAAAGLALVDLLRPWPGQRAALQFLDGPARRHYPTAVAGPGMLGGVLRLSVMPRLAGLDPFWGAGYANGYGFTAAARWPRVVFERHRYLGRPRGYAIRAFDQGVGRYLWWEVIARGPEEAARMLQQFAPERHADLWAGMGAAGTFAAGAEGSVLAEIRELAGAHGPQLAFGAIGAAYTRHLSNVPNDATNEAACRAYTGWSVADAVDEVRDLHEAVVRSGAVVAADDVGAAPTFELWRRAVVERFS